MFDLEKMFEEIESRARKINGLRYGSRVFLFTSLLFFALATLHFSKIFTFGLPGQLLYTALPISFSAISYLIGGNRNPDLHKFTYKMDKRLNTGGKLSSLYQLKENKEEKALSNLLARRFIEESPSWKKAFQLPFSAYFAGSSAAVAFCISVLLMFLPQPEAQVNTGQASGEPGTKNEIFPEGQTTIEKLKIPHTSREKRTGRGKGGKAPLSSIPEKKGTSNEEKVMEQGKPGESINQNILKLSGKKYPSGGKTTKANKRSSGKRIERSLGDNSPGDYKKEVIEAAEKSTSSKSLKEVEKSTKLSVKEENRPAEKNLTKGENGRKTKNTGSITKGEKSKKALAKSKVKLNEPITGKRKKTKSPGRGAKSNSPMEEGTKGRNEGPEGFPRIEKREKKRRNWKAGSAKRDSDSKKAGKGPKREPGFSNRSLSGEFRKVSPLPKFLDKGYPIKEEDGGPRDRFIIPGKIKKIRSVVETRELDPNLVSIIKEYFTSLREGGE